MNVFDYLSHRTLFCYKSFFAVLSSLIRSTSPNPLSTFFFSLTVTSSLVPAILCITSLQIRSAKLTLHILRRDLTAFILRSFFFCNNYVSLSYNSVRTTAKRAAVLTFRDLLNATKVPLPRYRLQYAFPHPFRIFHLCLTYFLIPLFFHPSSFIPRSYLYLQPPLHGEFQRRIPRDKSIPIL